MRYPEDFIDKVICGDCLEVMKHIPDKAVDLVVTDPPYGIEIATKSNNYGNSTHRSRKADGANWDSKFPNKEYWQEIFRISKNQIVFGANYGWENFWSTQCYIIWDKRGDYPDVPFCPTEFAWTSLDRMSLKYTCINHGFIRDCHEPRLHPTQKPIALMRGIIGDCSTGNTIILDPFAGSGTTLVAAKQLGRHYIGIEISPQYCKIAEERLKQTELFAPEPLKPVATQESMLI